MTPNDNVRERLFNAAAEIDDSAQRAAFLDFECGGDAALRAEIDELLRHDVSAGSFLGRPAGADVTIDHFTPVVEKLGTQIGPYQLVEVIGEGGFGQVFLAEQKEPVRRQVALKVIKPGMDTREVLARFAAERQALALMDHPNIAKVFDGGATESGRPYFVMELVRGMSITDFCDRHQLAPTERLQLFVTVCQAVQHAHQKGIIHRDIKPSNILVSLQDGKPAAKVIDFGVAKAIGQQLSGQTIYTQVAQMIGTPLYMSPEQAETGSQDIDTRSDIYSLGVLLYELLTGTTPFDKQRFANAALDEIRRVIREEEPEKPSTRLSHITDSLPSVAALRKTEPAKLSKLFRGDLDWITMKALEKERSRRYETANGMAIDVMRFLADEPVSAGPPSASYRLSKFVKRNRGTVLAAVSMLLLLIAGIVGTTWGMLTAQTARKAETERADGEANERQRAEKAEQVAKDNEDKANKERDRAEEEAQVAMAVRTFLQRKLLLQADPFEQANMLVASGEGLGKAKPNPTIRELLDRAAAECAPERIDKHFPNQHKVQAGILDTIGSAYYGLGELSLTLSFLKRSLDMHQRYYGVEDTRTLRTMHNLGSTYLRLGRWREALPILEKASELKLKTKAANDPVLFNTLRALAAAYSAGGKHTEAIGQLEKLTERCREALGPDDTMTLSVLESLASAYNEANRVNDALRVFEQVRDRRLIHPGPTHPSTLSTLNNLANALIFANRLPEAIAILEQLQETATEKIGATSTTTTTAQVNLVNAYVRSGKHEKAVTLGERILPVVRTSYGPQSRQLSMVRTQLLAAYYELNQYAKSVLLDREILEHERQREKTGRSDLAGALQRLGLDLLRTSEYAEAETVLRECLSVREAKTPDAWQTFNSKAQLGVALLLQKRYAEAEPHLVQGYEGMKQREDKLPKWALGRFGEALRQVVQLYEQWGRPEEAAKWTDKLPKSDNSRPKP